MRGRRLHLFVLIDALGWQFLQGREFLSDLLPFRTPLRTVLGFSSGAIPTILTGLPPAQNGHWNLFYYDPAGSPFRWLRHFRFLPDRVLNHRVTRKLLKELGRHVLGLGSNFECCVSPRLLPWFNWVEKRNIYDRGGITGAPSIFDQLSGEGIPYRVYSYHAWSDEEILKRARQDLKAGECNFFFLYLCEMDMFLHNQCKDHLQLEKRLGWYASGLRDLFELARKLDSEATFTVFSDHGMTPVKHDYDLLGQVKALGLDMPSDYLAVYDSTMARFWFFTSKARQGIAERLKTLSCGRIVPDEELRQLGIWFPDRRYGELIFLMHPGWLIAQSDFNGRGWMPAGMHGYHPDDPYSDAIFLSNRKPLTEMRTIADIYEFLRETVESRESKVDLEQSRVGS
jgi:predicted AlkP superfamily pyrophosphatase or phosphodiesterase